jgi:hypothetical protein
MISQPHYRTHAEQQAMLGCAANLDPQIHPRRHALQKARERMGREFAKTVNQYEQSAKAAFEERLALANRARFYADMSIRDAADALGISYHAMRKLKTEFALAFRQTRSSLKSEDNDEV